MFFKLAVNSLLSRKGSVFLTVMAMTVSIIVLLGVEHIRHQAKQSFASTVSGVDLVVGARTGSLNLLLYSVFRIGSPTNNIRWETYQNIAANDNIKWTIPLSLGDSHKGYRVLGTTQDFFKYFSYGKKHSLSLRNGEVFTGVFDVVLGAEVARKLNYELGDKIVLAHGLAATSFSLHDDRPFTVVGILEPTGTPVDQTLHVSLQGIEAIHAGWQQGIKMPGRNISKESLEQTQLTPKQVTAVLLGLKSRIATFSVQRALNNYSGEPLLAILPGVALSELWQMMGILENTLRLISALVFIAALFGLSAMLMASIRERSKEVALLRVIGASTIFVFLLIELEAVLIVLVSALLAAVLLAFSLYLTQDMLTAQFGLYISHWFLTVNSFYLLLILFAATIVAAWIPALKARPR